MSANFRIMKDISQLYQENNEYITISEENLPERIVLKLKTDDNSIYKGDSFFLEIKFKEGYPFIAPIVQFVDGSIPVHPHVFSNGHICLSVLSTNWSAALSIFSICLSVLSMLNSCKKKIRPIDNEYYIKKGVTDPSLYRYIYTRQIREKTMKTLILGCFGSTSNSVILTNSAAQFDTKLSGKITKLLKSSKFDGKSLKPRYFQDLCPEYPMIVVAGLGAESAPYCPNEEINLKFENIRCGMFRAIKVCDEFESTDITLDDCGSPKCVGEIVELANHEVGKWKSDYKPKNKIYSLLSTDNHIKNEYNEGLILGQAQTFAATLAETPANLKTPVKVAELIVSKMPPSVKCTIRDKKWIQEQNMGMFLSVNQGSVEPPVLLEAVYNGCSKQGCKPIVLVGKGITFDSGGISLKPAPNMSDMKADMQGAAVVFATIWAIAKLEIPICVVGLAPFTENLPSGSATKPGDVYTAKNGKTVEIDNTDAEGRLVLGDTLVYAHSFDPAKIIDLATLTGAVAIALGQLSSAIYSKSPGMVKDFKMASSVSGDRVWHMPLYKGYTKMVESKVADLVNSTKKREAGSCTAAAFLSEFVKINDWAHLDIAGVMTADKELIPYCPGGMSGRPTRTLIEYLKLQNE